MRAMDEGCWVLGPRCPFWLPPEWQRGAALTDLLRAVWEPAASLSVLINLCQKRPAVTRLRVFYGSGSALHLHVTLSRGFVLYLVFVLRLPAVRPLGGSRHNALWCCEPIPLTLSPWVLRIHVELFLLMGMLMVLGNLSGSGVV